MSEYAQKAAELATDPSTHALAVAFSWLAYRLERIHRNFGRRLRRHHKRLRKVEHAVSARRPAFAAGMVAP